MLAIGHRERVRTPPQGLLGNFLGDHGVLEHDRGDKGKTDRRKTSTSRHRDDSGLDHGTVTSGVVTWPDYFSQSGLSHYQPEYPSPVPSFFLSSPFFSSSSFLLLPRVSARVVSHDLEMMWTCQQPHGAAFCRNRRGQGSEKEIDPSLIAHSFLSMKGTGFISGLHIAVWQVVR